MEQTLIVRGRYSDRTFIPDGPMPDEEGAAELIITLTLTVATGSIADAFGSASILRTKEDILVQVRQDRDEWGDR